MYSQDLRDQESRQGSSGSPSRKNQIAAMSGPNHRDPALMPMLDYANDARWAGDFDDRHALHAYFDYFFTGQDIQIYIDGVEGHYNELELPIMGFGYSAQQQKQPVWGFWNYTHSAVMHGTRIVNGSFTIATTSTDYMARMISMAAQQRANKNAKYVIRGLDKDEKNIEKYWTRNTGDDTAYGGGKSIWSSHPPFNFVIVYGIQSTSITTNGDARLEEVLDKYQTMNPLMADTNERLVASGPWHAMRTVIENVELQSVQVEFTPDGQVCAETYSFFARDVINPRLTTNYPNGRGKPVN